MKVMVQAVERRRRRPFPPSKFAARPSPEGDLPSQTADELPVRQPVPGGCRCPSAPELAPLTHPEQIQYLADFEHLALVAPVGRCRWVIAPEG